LAAVIPQPARFAVSFGSPAWYASTSEMMKAICPKRSGSPIRASDPGYVRRDRNLSKRLFFAATVIQAGPRESFLPGRQ
jgi:hypothetical protein